MNQFAKAFPNTKWKSRINEKTLSVCYTSDLGNMRVKVIEGFDKVYVKVKTQTIIHKATYNNVSEMFESLPVVLSDLDNHISIQ